MPDDVMLTSVVCPVHVALAVAVIILVGALARYTLGSGAVQGSLLTGERVCTNLVPRPMTVVFGLGTKLRLRMRTTLENGVLRNG